MATNQEISSFIGIYNPKIWDTFAEESTYEQLLDDLMDDKIDAIVLEYDMLKYIADRYDKCDVMLLYRSFMTIPKYIMFNIGGISDSDI